MRLQSKIRLVTTLLVLTSVACHKSGPPPLSLQECDPAGYISCIQQAAFLSVPVPDTNLQLTYSSRWANRQPGQGSWSTQTLGLGGWSINLLQHYDATNRTLIGGDGSWRLVDAVKLPSGELVVPSYDGGLAFIFDSAGRHLRTLDGHLGIELLKNTYDSSGRLSQVDGSAGGPPVHLLVQRDSNGAPQGLVGIDGGTTGVVLDSNGHLGAVTNPAGETTHVAWNSAGLVESETDPAGGVERFTYDSSGLLATSSDADDVTQHFERRASGDSLEIRVSTTLGRQWTYRAESVRGGIRRTFITPDGTQTTQVTDSRGNRTLKAADGTIWNVGMVANKVWGIASPILSPIVETRPDGVTSRREVKYNLQPQGGLPYVLAGSVTTVINGQPWTQNFDPAQHTADVVDPTGQRTALRYDQSGRVLSHLAPGMAPVVFTYNSQGRVESETIGAAGLARITRYQYDGKTGETVTIRADGVTEKVARDAAGRTVMMSAGDGATTVVSYDSAGRVNQIQPPGGLNFTLGISPADRPTAFAPPMVEGDGSIETSSYDKDGHLAAISGMGNRAVNYTYDSAGRLTSATFDQGKRSLFYDARSGLITQASDPSGINAHFGYAGSIPTSLSWWGPVNGAVVFTLDANGRAVRESVNSSNNLDFTYDPAGDLTGVGPLSFTRDPGSGLVTRTSLGVVETTQEFDADQQLIRATTTVSGKVVLDLRYTRDALGRIKSVTEFSGNSKPTTTEYSFDRANRLETIRVNGRVVETDGYDPAGDRTSIKRPNGLTKASYDIRQRILTFGKTQYLWEPDGTLKQRVDGPRATSFTYDDFGTLRQVTLPDGRKIQYLIDADGRRVGREIAGRLVAGYLYRSDGFLAAETDATGKIVSHFGYDNLGHLALVERDGVTYRVITDPLGSPRMILDSRTGAVVEQVAYDAWGNIIRDTAPGFIPISFAGGLRDPDTGLVKFGARDYDPTIGGWTAADPIRFAGGQVNLCSYVNDDPINARDPSGLCSIGMGGLTLGMSAISGMGGSFGLNLQYIQGAGWNVYGFAGGGEGFGTGVSLTGNLGTINNPSSNPQHDWEGWTSSSDFGVGPVSVGVTRAQKQMRREAHLTKAFQSVRG